MRRSLTSVRLLALVLMTTLAVVAWAQDQDSNESPRRESSLLHAKGSDIYRTHCASCHQPNGAGVEGSYPPLVRHAPNIASADGGRTYLVDVVLHGLHGPIRVRDDNFDSTMPSWRETLTDSQAAAVLNYVLTAWGNERSLPPGFEAFVPGEVSARRQQERAPSEVHDRRKQIVIANSNTPSQDNTGGDESRDRRSVLDGVYTEEQAESVRSEYRDSCEVCHGRTLRGGERGGPPLAGDFFMHQWSGKSLFDVFSFMKANMPVGSPGSLTDSTYADLLALILSANDFPPGGDRLRPEPELLRSIVLEEESD